MLLRNGKRKRHEDDSTQNKMSRLQNEESTKTKSEIENTLPKPIPKTLLETLPNEIILNVCKHLPLKDLQSLGCVSPGLACLAKDTALRRHVLLELWKGDDVFSHAVGLKHAVKLRNNIIFLTLECQQDPSSAKTEVTSQMLETVKKMRHLKHLRIQGAELTGSVIGNLPHSVETLELLDCSSSRGINFTKFRKQTGLRTICINDDHTFVQQIFLPVYEDLDWDVGFHLKRPHLFPHLKHFACPINSTAEKLYVQMDVIYIHMLMIYSIQELDLSAVYTNRCLSNTQDSARFCWVRGLIEAVDVRKIRELKVLRLSGWDCIDKELVETIVGIDSLCELHVDSCPRLHDPALDYIHDYHNIKLLNVSGCAGVTAEGVQKLRTRCPKLTVIF